MGHLRKIKKACRAVPTNSPAVDGPAKPLELDARELEAILERAKKN